MPPYALFESCAIERQVEADQHTSLVYLFRALELDFAFGAGNVALRSVQARHTKNELHIQFQIYAAINPPMIAHLCGCKCRTCLKHLENSH